MTIYKVLMHDLRTGGQVHAVDFTNAGYFWIDSSHRIRVTRVCPDTWQTRTAVLFMQQSYALIRRIRRENKDAFFPGRLLQAALGKKYLPSPLNPCRLQHVSPQSSVPHAKSRPPTGRLTPPRFAGIKTP
jgi:hypothetical protein